MIRDQQLIVYAGSRGFDVAGALLTTQSAEVEPRCVGWSKQLGGRARKLTCITLCAQAFINRRTG